MHQQLQNSTTAQLLENCRQIFSLEKLLSLPVSVLVLLPLSAILVSLTIWRGGLDPREPPLARAKIPLIGHVIGFARYSLQYLDMLRTRTGLGAYTIRIGTFKFYVICSPSLAQGALRSPDLNADLLVAKVAPQLMNLGKHVANILEKGDFAHQSHLAFTEKLSLNPSLSKTESAILDGMAALVNGLDDETHVQHFLKWLSDGMVLNNSSALYGPGNPIAEDPKLMGDMWTYEFSQSKLLIPYFSRLLAPGACAARARLTDAFRKYYEQNFHEQASDIVKARFENAQSCGFSIAESASFDLFLLTVAVVNVIPSLYWMLVHVFSEPDLIQELRSELEESQLLTESGSLDNGDRIVTLNLSRINETTAPLLMSTYREGLRCSNLNMPCREVAKDTFIRDPVTEETYLLKKGTPVLIPMATLHPSASVWGDDADKFDGRRWIKMEKLDKVEKKNMKQGFIPFGGGKHLCPGRHVAQVEILAMAAFMIMGCNVSGLDGNAVAVPEAYYDDIRKKPLSDFGVVITKRAAFKATKWRFVVDNGGTKGS